MNVIKRIGLSLAVLAAVALGPIAIASTAGATFTTTDAPPSDVVIVNNGTYPVTDTSDPSYAACTATPDFTSIQAAVNAEEAATTPKEIYVCAGVYVENVSINTTLTLLGAQWDTDGQAQPDSTGATYLVGGITYFPNISGPISGTVWGFNFRGNGASPAIWAAGAGSGWDFEENVIDASTGGIILNTDGVTSPTQTTIAYNQFWQSIPYATSSNAFAGEAVLLAGGSTADNVSIFSNDFLDLSGAQGDIYTPGPSTCTTGSDVGPGLSTGLSIEGNTYEQDTALTTTGNSFVHLVCTAGALIGGIGLFGDANVLTVTDTNDEQAVSPIVLGGGDFDAGVTGNELIGNGAFNSASGIEINSDSFPGDQPFISDNTISGFGEGVYVYGSSMGHSYTPPSDFYIEDNAISDSLVGVAIYSIFGAPSDITVTENTISDSTLYDCVDQTSGSGTVGTADTWSLNDASSSNPTGLCKTNVVTPGAPPTVAYAGGSGYTPTATALSGDTTTTSPAIAVYLDSSSTGCYLAGGSVGYTSSGTCVLDYYDPGNGVYGPASAQQSFAVGPGASGGGGSGATPASATNVTLTFNSEGGTSEPAQTVASGTSVTLPTPTLTGYTFLGWFTAASGGTLVTSPYDVTASTTLYAQWESNSATPAAAAFKYAFTIHTFVFGSSALTAQIEDQINHLVVLFNNHDAAHVTLRGNATLPNNTFNQKLATARALAVEGYMKRIGIHASITITSTVSGATYNFAYLVVYVTTP
jgi:uncharacterized repeat protein (TIGR02543 family)